MTDLDKKIPIKFTSSAFNEINRLAKLEDASKVLFIGVKSGGCSGLSYVFEFKAFDPNFQSYQIDELTFAISPLDLQHIENLEIDYEQGLNNRGFTFTNPNASTTCGCGTSFA